MTCSGATVRSYEEESKKRKNLFSCKTLDLEILGVVVFDTSCEDGQLHLILFNQKLF